MLRYAEDAVCVGVKVCGGVAANAGGVTPGAVSAVARASDARKGRMDVLRKQADG